MTAGALMSLTWAVFVLLGALGGVAFILGLRTAP
jgi:hypothetical protein